MAEGYGRQILGGTMSVTARVSDATKIDDLQVLARHIASDTSGQSDNYGKDRSKLAEQNQITIAEVNEALSVLIYRANKKKFAAIRQTHRFLVEV